MRSYFLGVDCGKVFNIELLFDFMNIATIGKNDNVSFSLIHKLPSVDFCGNGRIAYDVSEFCKERFEEGTYSVSQLKSSGIRVMRSVSDISGMECVDWIADYMGLSHYGGENNRGKLSSVVDKDLVDLCWTQMPLRNSLVCYFTLDFFGNGNRQYILTTKHWGAVNDPDGDIEVYSKWGESDYIFSHPLLKVPECYGNHVMFFEKR